MDSAQPVATGFVDAQVAPPGLFGVIGWVAVLVEQLRQPVGSLPEVGGPETEGVAGQIGLGLLAGGGINVGGQLIEELLEDAHVLSPDLTVGLGAAAVLASWGANGSPVIDWRGPNNFASSMRDRASPTETRSRVASRSARFLAPSAFGSASATSRAISLWLMAGAFHDTASSRLCTSSSSRRVWVSKASSDSIA